MSVLTNYDSNESIYGEMRIVSSPSKYASVSLDTDFESTARAIYVGSAGDLSVRDLDDNDITFVNVAAGGWFPVICKRVNTTGTTATNLIWGS